MKKNIFLMSLLRQPLRSLLLILLISLASFGFVLRMVEYTVVRSQINVIARHYRTVGLIQTQSPFGDATAAAEILENSPFVNFIEYRPSVQGILQDMRNTDIQGTFPWIPVNMRPSRSDFFFYGYPREIVQTDYGVYVHFWIARDDTIVGHPEFMIATAPIGFTFPPHVILFLPGAHNRYVFEDMEYEGRIVTVPVEGGYHTSFDPLGGRYFIRGYQYVTFDLDGPVRPNTARAAYGQQFRAINHEMPDEEPIFFIPVPRDEGIDLAAHGLRYVYDVMRDVERSQHSIILRTTSDMLILPFARGVQPPVRIMRGRHIYEEDYLNARPVAVINIHLAMGRGLEVGDTIRVAVPVAQHFSLVHTIGYPDLLTWGDAGYAEEMLELEIVGIFQYTVPGLGTRASLTVYVPTTVLPESLTVLPPADPTWQMAGWDENHLPSGWLSFTLADSRQEQEFERRYSELFYERGFNMVLIRAYADDFWASATMILTTVMFNAVVFSIALVLVVCLGIFLYLRNSHRNLAISRATGTSRGRLVLRFCVSAAALGIPAIMAGAIPAWVFSLNAAQETLLPVMEIAAGIQLDMELELVWLGVFSGVILALILVLSLLGSSKLLSVPVLALLQGQTSKPRADKTAIKIKSDTASTVADVTKFEEIRISASKLPTTFGAKMGGSIHWIGKHISRQPVKTAMGVAIALFFILMIGWLQENIVRTNNRVDYIHDTNVVLVDIHVGWGVGQHGAGLHGIPLQLEHRFRELPYVENIYLESSHGFSFVMPRGDEDVFPANWAEIIGYDMTRPIRYSVDCLDPLYAFNNLDTFVRHNTRGGADRYAGDIEVILGDGFSPEIFIVTSENLGEVVPLVLYEGTMEYWGLEIGDSIWLAYTLIGAIRMSGTPAIVAGVHNGNILREALQEAVLIPTAYKERHVRWARHHMAMSFNINTAYNREIAEIRGELELIASPGYIPDWGGFPIFILDQELRNAAVAIGQSLLFLEMLYPLAVAVCISIGLGVALLMMMQNTKNAAIMRVLGIAGNKVRGVLFVEQMVICLAGVMAGFSALVFMGWGFGFGELATFAAAYVAGAAAGSAVGSVIVTGKPPLDLLQTRE